MVDLEDLAPERLRPISRAEYERMVAMGLFEDERVELLRGMLVEMSPQGTDHAEVVRRLNRALLLALHDRADLSPQCPYAASEDSEPEPDIALVPRGDYGREHPAKAYLLVEVARSSLRKDRVFKAKLYAESGVPEYWVVDLDAEEVEVHTRPTAAGTYADVARHGRGARVRLQAFPDVEIAVDAILPATDGASTERL